MISRPLVLGLLAACMTAGAGGAFMAVRQNAAERAAAPFVAAPVATAPSSPSATQPVSETEATVAASPAAAPKVDAPAEAQAVEADKPQPLAASVASGPSTSNQSRAKTAARNDRTATRRDTARTQRPMPSASNAPPDRTSTVAARPNDQPSGTRDALPAAAPAAEASPSTTARLPEVVPVPEPRFVEVVLPSSSVIGLQVDRPISSERARVEDRVEARVTRDVMAGGRVAIPAGSHAIGAVTLVERGGKLKDRARLGVRFHTLVLADGVEVPIQTESILREGDPPSGESARKIGGAAVGGAILGAILGGGKGAMIGGATGAGAGTAAVMASDRNAATLPAGAVVTVRLSSPVTVQVERN